MSTQELHGGARRWRGRDLAWLAAAGGIVALIGFGSTIRPVGQTDAGLATSMTHEGHAMGSMDHDASAAPARPVTTIRPISCTPLPDLPGKAITTVVVDFPPDAYTPRHRHPGTVTAFVLSGTLHSQLAGGPPETFTVGQSWFEPPNAVHLYAENASKTEPASILAIFIADENCGPLTILDKEGDASGAK
jgi:quercetin dioxygenase-like cupin family protein